MKVLVVTDVAIDDQSLAGGATGFLRGLKPYFGGSWAVASLDISARAASHTPPVPAGPQFLRLGPALRGRYFPRRISFPLLFLGHALALRRFRPDVIYSHSNEVAMLLASSPVRRLLGQPVVVLHQHGAANPLRQATFRWARLGILQSLYDVLLRHAHRHVDLIIAIDAACVRKNMEWGIAPEHILLIPNAIDIGSFSPPTLPLRRYRAMFDLPLEGILAMHAGRMEEVKRQDVILHGFKRFLERLDGDRAATLALAGAGSLEPALRRLAADLGLTQHVRFLGGLSGSQMADLYRASDMFVLASEVEAVPMVALEALASGVPVLSTSVGGVPELVAEGCGILYGPTPNEERLCAALLRATETPWNRAAIADSVSRFSAQQFVATLTIRFRELIAAKQT